jgi:hypothetical protein
VIFFLFHHLEAKQEKELCLRPSQYSFSTVLFNDFSTPVHHWLSGECGPLKCLPIDECALLRFRWNCQCALIGTIFKRALRSLLGGASVVL